MLERCVALSLEARRNRLNERFPPTPTEEAIDDETAVRRRAALMVERVLVGRPQDSADASPFFHRLATRLQLASCVIETMMTSVALGTADATRARALAIVIADLVYYAENCVPAGGLIRIYLAIGHEDDQLVVGLGVDGVDFVPTRSASVALLRARSIVQLMGGDFQRGTIGSRLIFGLIFPSDALDVASR